MGFHCSARSDHDRQATDHAAYHDGDQPTEADLRSMKDEGYVGIVNVRNDGEPDQPLGTAAEGERARALGIDYLHFGVGAAPLSEQGVASVCEFLDAHSEGKVLVHCRKGGRAAALVLLQQANANNMERQRSHRAGPRDGPGGRGRAQDAGRDLSPRAHPRLLRAAGWCLAHPPRLGTRIVSLPSRVRGQASGHVLHSTGVPGPRRHRIAMIGFEPQRFMEGDMTRGVGGQSPANVQKFLHGIHYPANKDDLIATAQERRTAGSHGHRGEPAGRTVWWTAGGDEGVRRDQVISRCDHDLTRKADPRIDVRASPSLVSLVEDHAGGSRLSCRTVGRFVA